MKVVMNRMGINKVKQDVQVALIETAEAIKTDLIQSQTMPFDAGTMQNDSTFVDTKRAIKGVASIIVDTKYARKVYFDPEIEIKTEKNPNAKQYYFDDYISGNKKDLPIMYFQKIMLKRNGG